MTFAPYRVVRATRDPSFRFGPTPILGTLRDVGVVSYECPFCPDPPEGEPRPGLFGPEDGLRELVHHYFGHRARQMIARTHVRCPCCNGPLRPHYWCQGPRDTKFLRSHPAGGSPPAAFLHAELSHFLRGSLGIPEAWTRMDDPVFGLWGALTGEFTCDPEGQLHFTRLNQPVDQPPFSPEDVRAAVASGRPQDLPLCLIVDKQGRVDLVPFRSRGADSPQVAVRAAAFCGDNMVGPEAARDERHVQQHYTLLREGWIRRADEKDPVFVNDAATIELE